MTEQNFSIKELPKYPGYLVGIRAMEIEPDGVIQSPQQDHAWKATVNKARCLLLDDGQKVHWTTAHIRSGQIYSTGTNLVTHKIAMRDCTCGFYAYFKEVFANTYMPADNGIFAIVKAYGRLTYGNQGFRAEKMEILALAYDVDKPVLPKPKAPERPPVRFITLSVVLCLILLLAGVVGSFLLPFPVGSLLIWAGAGVAIAVAKTNRKRFSKYWEEVSDYHDALMIYREVSVTSRMWGMAISSQYLARLKRRYPGIPVFESVDEAVAAFPLTDPKSIVR